MKRVPRDVEVTFQERSKREGHEWEGKWNGEKEQPARDSIFLMYGRKQLMLSVYIADSFSLGTGSSLSRSKHQRKSPLHLELHYRIVWHREGGRDLTCLRKYRT